MVGVIFMQKRDYRPVSSLLYSRSSHYYLCKVSVRLWKLNGIASYSLCMCHVNDYKRCQAVEIQVHKLCGFFSAFPTDTWFLKLEIKYTARLVLKPHCVWDCMNFSAACREPSIGRMPGGQYTGMAMATLCNGASSSTYHPESTSRW